MTEAVTDSTNIAATDTVADTLPQTEFLIGNLIPFSRSENVRSFITISTDSSLNIVYAPGRRDSGQPLPEALVNTDFCFVILSLALVLLTLMSIFGRKSIAERLSFLSFRRRQELPLSSAAGIFSWPLLARNIFTVLNISMFATISLALTGNISPLPGFATIKITSLFFIIFLSVLLLRHLTCIIIAGFSGQKNLFREYLAIIYSAWFVAGLITFVLSAIILFTPLENPVFLIITGFALIVLLLFLRIIRLLYIFISRHASILYFILYLCALEVLPVLVILKLVGIF